MLNQPLFAALDVSLETTTICIMSFDGTITKEAVVATEPDSIAICLGDDLTRIERIGLEAGPLSEWLVRELSVLGIVVTLLETRQVRAALSAMIIKTDRKDARGMAHLLRTGWFRPVHVKSLSAREQRAMLAARSMLVARLKDIENSVRGLLRGFGLRLPRALRGRWEAGVREAIEGHPTLVQIFELLLMAREALREQLIILDKWVRDAARADRVCRRLMSAPGVGAIGAMTFRAAVDQPDRFRSSKRVGACFGLTLENINPARPTEVAPSAAPAEADPIVARLIAAERQRQAEAVELVASENFVSRAVLAAQGSIFTNKTVVGYPGKRFHAGAEHADELERIAIERACAAFGSTFANVQSYSGIQANLTVFRSLLVPGDVVLSMSGEAGGHFSHGAASNLSRTMWRTPCSMACAGIRAGSTTTRFAVWR